MTGFCKTWYVGSGGHKYYPRGLSLLNARPTKNVQSVWDHQK